MANSVSERVGRRRANLRAAGLRPVQIWVPDTRAQGFSSECRRQSLIVAQADAAELDMATLLDAAFADLSTDDV